ncbi:MAG TPA: DegT/DnrJ/EryC1/StrS family aminotransferase [Vicinamibacterales bacterium]|nr:DegT/DnrJ/EryC1/StrS family aminotransferase [Vicinamibacterales bacterium]
MRIGRTVPPAAAPLCWRALWHGLAGAFAGGRAIRAREDEIRRQFDVGHVFLVSSGSAALALALMALKSLSARSQVVIPAYTCFSVPAAVLKAGLRPVLCDIDPDTFDFDHALLERTITQDTLCVVTHHLFGVPSDVERTKALCRPNRIFVVEDAAQAMGIEARGGKLGTLGDLGVFSFGRGKNVTCGSGGALITRSSEIAAAIRRRWMNVPAARLRDVARDVAQLALMTVFIRPRLYWVPASLTFLRLGETTFPSDVPVRRMAGITAGLLRGWRERLLRSNQARRETATYFHRRLPVPAAAPHPYLRMPLLASSPGEKDKLCSLSRARGLGLSAAYPTPVSDIPQIRSAFRGQQFPSARRVAENLLTLPTHHWLSDRDKQAIADLWRAARIA